MRFPFFALAILFTVPARADSVNVQLFKSPFNLNYGMVEGAIHDGIPWDEAAPNPKYFLSGDYHYVKDPLVVIDTNSNTRKRILVDSVHTLDLSVGYFFNPDTSIYAQLPVNISALPNAGRQFDLGDSRVALKHSLSEPNQALNLAIMPELTLPSGNKARFLSDNSLGAALIFLAEHDFGSFRITGNLGYRYSSNARMAGIDYRSRLPIGLGAVIPLSQRWAANLEGTGALAFPTGQRQNASEFYAGLNYHPEKYMAVILGGSMGAFDKAGASDYRVQAAFRMYLAEGKTRRPAPVVQEEEEPAPRPKPKARLVQNQIEIYEEIQFDHNQDKLKNVSKQVLDEVADIIRSQIDTLDSVEIEGHTSLVGTDAYNMKLSWRRARSVVSYLVIEQKIPAKLLKAKGYGESRPKFLPGKSTPAQLELNRRVEFKIIRSKSAKPAQ